MKPSLINAAIAWSSPKFRPGILEPGIMTTQMISPLLRLQMVNLFRSDASPFQHISCILGQPWGDHYHKRVLGTNESQSQLQDQSTRQIGWSCEQGHIGQVVAHVVCSSCLFRISELLHAMIFFLPKQHSMSKESPLKVRKVTFLYIS